MKKLWKVGIAIIAITIIAITLIIQTSWHNNIDIAHVNGITFIQPKTTNTVLFQDKYNTINKKYLTKSLSRLCKKASYDGVMYGRLQTNDGEIMLINNKYNIKLTDIIEKIKEFKCSQVLAFVDNPENIILTSPFKYTTKGEKKYSISSPRIMGFIPRLWDDNKTFNIKMKNMNLSISDTLITLITDTRVEISCNDMIVEDSVITSINKICDDLIKQMVKKDKSLPMKDEKEIIEL